MLPASLAIPPVSSPHPTPPNPPTQYVRKQSTFPSEREQWIRVAIKAYVSVYGVILFVVFRHTQEFQATRHDAYNLWVFFSVTVWANVVSCCLLPFNLKASLEQARRMRQEEQQNSRLGIVGGNDRPLSGSSKALPYQQHESHYYLEEEHSPTSVLQSPGGAIGVRVEARLA